VKAAKTGQLTKPARAVAAEESADFDDDDDDDDDDLADDDDEAWVGWLKSIALLGLRDMAPMVYRSLDEGRAPDWVINRKDFDEILAEAEQRPDDATRFEEFRIGDIADVVEALESSDLPEPDEEALDGVLIVRERFGGQGRRRLVEVVEDLPDPWLAALRRWADAKCKPL